MLGNGSAILPHVYKIVEASTILSFTIWSLYHLKLANAPAKNLRKVHKFL